MIFYKILYHLKILVPPSSSAWVDEYFLPNNPGSGDLPYMHPPCLILQSQFHIITNYRTAQFACKSQWRHQIPLHWRLKESLKGIDTVVFNILLHCPQLNTLQEMHWTCFS